MNSGNTKERIDIHHTGIRMKGALKALETSDICDRDKELILEFVRHKKIAGGIGELREAKTVATLRILAESWGKGLDTLPPKKRTPQETKKARERLITLLDTAYNRWIVIKNQPERKPSMSTQRDYYIFLKMFYGWMIDSRHPPEFEWIKIPAAPPKKIKPQELLTLKDVHKLAASAQNARDRLLPQLLFDVGGRITEIANIRRSDIEAVDGGDFYRIHIAESKTDVKGEQAARTIIIDDSAPALTKWLDEHPLKARDDYLLFVAIGGNHNLLDYDTIRRILMRLRERAGLEKNVNPHFFRKSATSYLRNKKKMNDASLKTRHGWKQSSRMLDIYASIDQEEANQDYLRAKGKLRDEERQEKDEIEQMCKWCNTKNPLGVKFCQLCKRPLDLEKHERRKLIEDETRARELIQEVVSEMLPEGILRDTKKIIAEGRE